MTGRPGPIELAGPLEHMRVIGQGIGSLEEDPLGASPICRVVKVGAFGRQVVHVISALFFVFLCISIGSFLFLLVFSWVFLSEAPVVFAGGAGMWGNRQSADEGK